MSSEFTGDGFTSFPNLHSDRKEASAVVEWDDDRLDYKIQQYWAFMDREDVMPRGRRIGQEILDLLGFEIDERFKERELRGNA